MRERWNRLCERVAATGPGLSEEENLTYEMILTLYSHPVRAYHNLEHIRQCLEAFDLVRLLAEEKDCVEYAIWLHDCVFIAERPDNEVRSADTAGAVAALLGCRAEFMHRARELIMVTRHDRAPATGDESLVADIDLSILGSGAAEYAAYRRAIRKEFRFADDGMFRAGRCAFLRRMLEREAIYSTVWFKRELEGRARGNMERELEEIEGAKT
jgi:predicted metal-dependent HD superfamily phosphohydrolase